MANPYRKGKWSQYQHIHQVWHVRLCNKASAGVKPVSIRKHRDSLEATEKLVTELRDAYPSDKYYLTVEEVVETTYSVP